MVPKQLVVDGDPTCISLKVAASGLQFPLGKSSSQSQLKEYGRKGYWYILVTMKI